MVEKDETKAAELFEEAATRYGHTGANYLIGMAYLYGQGVPQSDSLSFNFLKIAADRRVPEAEHVISSYYLRGKGVTQSTKIGLIYLKRAADGGMKAAQQTLGQMHREGKFVKKSNSTARHYETLALTSKNQITFFAILR